MNRRDKRIVVPGEELAVIEEYFPGEGTYVDSKQGVIRALCVGETSYDDANRRVQIVRPLKTPDMPKPESLIIGVISSLRDELAVVTIHALWGGKLFNNTYAGILHISQASETFIKSMYELYRPSDIILAKVLSRNYPFQLTTKAPSLGVLLSSCSLCGSTLVKKGGNTLVCSSCGNVEKRKVSIHYSRIALKLGVKSGPRKR